MKDDDNQILTGAEEKLRKIMSNALGPDKVHPEILKVLGYEDGSEFGPMRNLSNIIYKEWLKSIFVVLPKNANASKFVKYRMISLMSYVLKNWSFIDS